MIILTIIKTQITEKISKTLILIILIIQLIKDPKTFQIKYMTSNKLFSKET